MANKYRLSAKPGIARVGRRISTKNRPIIIVNKQGSKANTALPKLKSEDKVGKVIIRKPPTRTNRPRQNREIRRKQISQARGRKNKEHNRYREAIESLKGSGRGRILIIVACGPSILEADLPSLNKHPLIDIMSINKPDPRLHPTKFWVFCDQSQYLRNKDTFEGYSGTVINAWSVRARHSNQILIRNKSGRGFSKNLLQGYYIGRSTTFANMQVAFWMDYDKVYIFGCDMSQSDGQLHFYGRNPDVEPTIRVKRFQKEAEHYLAGAKQLTPQERLKFIFCSSYNKWPFLEFFPRLDHKEAPEKILSLADNMLEKQRKR